MSTNQPIVRCFLISLILLLKTGILQAEPAALNTPTGVIHGTLTLPSVAGPRYPVVLIISGSGPTDRDGNSVGIPGGNNCLKLLSEGLAAKGIASLRFDKRGVAGSLGAGTKEADLRFETYINDAALWGAQLRKDRRFSTLTIIGHSEGSLIGMVAARKIPADGFVSIAGAGFPAGTVILKQLRPKLPPELMKESQTIIDTLNSGKTVPYISPELDALFRPSVQPYLISWFRYDPAQEIRQLSIPVLIVQGSTDIQVTEQDAKALYRAKPGAKLVIIPGMNHVFKMVPADPAKQISSYSDPKLPVSSTLIGAVSSFTKGIKSH